MHEYERKTFDSATAQHTHDKNCKLNTNMENVENMTQITVSHVHVSLNRNE